MAHPAAATDGRFVVEIPIRWSKTDERIALARMRTAQRITNEVLAEYLGRRDAYQRDPDLRRLRAELREAKREGRADGKPPAKAAKSVPIAVTPRVFQFSTKSERNVAWRELRERHGLLGESKVASLSTDGAAHYERTKTLIKGITGRQSALGSSGLDAATIHHQICAPQRDRVLEYCGAKKREGGAPSRPRFASRRDPITSVTGSSSMKNAGALRVDLAGGAFTWKGAHGAHPITARMRPPKNDPWLAKALALPIAQVRVLHRMLRGRQRWYVQLVMVGEPPVDPQLRSAIAARPASSVGVDVGSRHIAAVGATAAILADLAPTMIAREAARDERIVTDRDGDRRKKDRWYRRLQRRMSLKRARLNAAGDVVRMRAKTLTKTRDGKAVGKEIRVPAGFKKGVRIATSARIGELNSRLAESARADAAARKNDHGRLVNALVTMGDELVLEKLSYVGWQKAFGRQVRRHAPGAFEALLRQRARLFGATVVDVKTSATKLSQVCHTCGAFSAQPIRGPIATRVKPACECGRPEIHRDLYSAFLASFASETSVDLHAAQAAWTGAFGLLSGARRMYDRVEDRRVFRLSRADDAQASPLRARVPRAQADGFTPPATVNAKRATPASVRDNKLGSEHGRTTSSGGGGASRPHDRSKSVRRAPLPLFDVREYGGKVRAGPPLDARPANAGAIRDG
jgi:transposase